MERRKFLSWAGVGVLATSLPAVLAACSSTYESSEASTDTSAEPIASDAPVKTAPAISDTPDADGFYEVGTTAQLTDGGAITSKKFASASGALIVIQDPANAEGVVALDARCPHQGCAVDWKGEKFVCPCHASAFGVDGAVLQGPATEGLPVFESKVDGEKVLVKPA